MAGHSQFKNIMHRKGAQDIKRGRIFAKLIREITVSAKLGLPDPAMNPRLRAAMTAARQQNLPKDTIDRAVKKATGAGGEADYVEMRYEGYGPAGVAVIVESLTDNRNRTASDVRTAFAKSGGALGETNSVAFLFSRLGVVRYAASVADEDTMLEAAIEAGAENVESTADGHEVTVPVEDFFAVRDALKTNAAKVVARLQAQGLKTFLLTGDNPLTAASIAKQVGIAAENVFAEVRPEQKAEFVKRLQARGERVAFVGDGINDAPALTQADLGIAVSRASDVAREAADIILLKSEIEAVPEALGLARATLRTIKQNLFWAFFYNALGVPLAACDVISPIFCAAAMGVSDLVVIGNALRLLRWRPK